MKSQVVTCNRFSALEAENELEEDDYPKVEETTLKPKATKKMKPIQKKESTKLCWHEFGRQFGDGNSEGAHAKANITDRKITIQKPVTR